MDSKIVAVMMKLMVNTSFEIQAVHLAVLAMPMNKCRLKDANILLYKDRVADDEDNDDRKNSESE